MELKVELSWPSKILQPNTKTHWAKKHRAGQIHKHEAYYAATHAYLEWFNRLRIEPYFMPDSPVDVHVVFYPPDNRRRDEDNMLASLKHQLDGIAEAIGVNDRWFRLSHEVALRVKGGKVIVILSQE